MLYGLILMGCIGVIVVIWQVVEDYIAALPVVEEKEVVPSVQEILASGYYCPDPREVRRVYSYMWDE